MSELRVHSPQRDILHRMLYCTVCIPLLRIRGRSELPWCKQRVEWGGGSLTWRPSSSPAAVRNGVPVQQTRQPLAVRYAIHAIGVLGVTELVGWAWIRWAVRSSSSARNERDMLYRILYYALYIPLLTCEEQQLGA